METVRNKIVFITGASSGIGLSCARLFAENGAKIIVAARRVDRLEALAKQVKKKYKTNILVIKLDVRKQKEVEKTVRDFPKKWREIDILINNAGLSRGLDKLHEGKIIDWEEMIDTNIKGLLYVSRAVIPLMVKRNSGHVINIGSIAGHEVYPKGNVYCATKHAVEAITKGMRLDLNGTAVKVTTIDPGLVETEFSLVRYRGDNEKAQVVYNGITALTGDDIAEAVLFAATRSKKVVVAEMMVLPLDQASTNFVFRR